MEIDSTHLALVVQGTIKRAKEGDPLAKETLEQWNRANQEDGLPPMEQLLRDWVEKNQPKESEAPKQGELTPEEERELVVDGMMIGMDFITEDGAVKYADFFAQMVNTFGDGIRPYVAQIYLGLSAKVDDDTADQMDDRATVRKFNVNTIVLPPVVMQNLEQFVPQVSSRSYRRVVPACSWGLPLSTTLPKRPSCSPCVSHLRST